MKGLRTGTLAELVDFIARLPETEREAFVIAKAG